MQPLLDRQRPGLAGEQLEEPVAQPLDVGERLVGQRIGRQAREPDVQEIVQTGGAAADFLLVDANVVAEVIGVAALPVGERRVHPHPIAALGQSGEQRPAAARLARPGVEIAPLVERPAEVARGGGDRRDVVGHIVREQLEAIETARSRRSLEGHEERVGLHRIEDDVVDVAFNSGCTPTRRRSFFDARRRDVRRRLSIGERQRADVADADQRQGQREQVRDDQAATASQLNEDDERDDQKPDLDQSVAKRLLALDLGAVERPDLDRRVDVGEQQEQAEAEQRARDRRGRADMHERDQPDHDEAREADDQAEQRNRERLVVRESPIVAGVGVDAERNEREHDDEEGEREPIVSRAGRQGRARAPREEGSDRSQHRRCAAAHGSASSAPRPSTAGPITVKRERRRLVWSSTRTSTNACPYFLDGSKANSASRCSSGRIA